MPHPNQSAGTETLPQSMLAMSRGKYVLTILKYLGIYFAHTILYLIVVFLCILGGSIANPNIKTVSDLITLYHTSWGVHSTLWAMLAFFLFYFVLRLLLVDRPAEWREGTISTNMIWISIFYLVVYVGSGVWLWHTDTLPNFWLLLSVTLPCTIMLLYSCWVQRKSDHSHAQNFLPMIFYPAFSVCFLSFCLGWALASMQSEAFFLGLPLREFIYCIFSLMFIIFFVITRWFDPDTPHTVAAVFTALLGISVSFSWWFAKEVGLSLIIALVWTFALGVTEVAKRAHLVEHKKALAGRNETGKFYAAGANWSSILFFNLLLLMPVLVPSPVMLFIVVIAWGLIVFWHMVRDKYSLTAYFGSLSMGFVLPTAMIALFALAKTPKLNLIDHLPVSSATDRFITLLGIFLTIIFVLYHKDYITMTAQLRTNSHDWFMSRRSCLLFAALTVAVEAVLLTFIFSILDTGNISEGTVPQIQFQVDFVLAFLIFELIAILVMLFLTPDSPDSKTTESHSEKESIQGSEIATAPSARIALAFARPVNSSIAGLLSFAAAIHVSEMNLFPAIGVFVSTMALCMSGYIANDIFDREKDQRAGRTDKLVALGLVSGRSAASLGAALLLTSLATALLVSDSVFFIVCIGSALVLGYSCFSCNFPKLKGLYTALLCCLPVFIGAGVDLSPLNFQLLLLISLFIFGREMLIDIADMNHDKLSRHFTLALALGPQRAAAIGWLAMLASGPIIFSIETSFVGRLIATLAVASLLVILLLCGWRNAERSVSLSRIPMLLTIVVFLFRS